MQKIKENTICSVSTKHGEGAIAIIRISGKKATNICKKIFIYTIQLRFCKYLISKQTLQICHIVHIDALIKRNDVLMQTHKLN